MLNFLITINLLLFFIYFYKTSREGMHILQLESYFNKRYEKWIKKNKSKTFNTVQIWLLVIPAVLMLFKIPIVSVILNILSYLLLIYVTKKGKEKKPFVITSRIKRMILTYVVLFTIICAVTILNYRIGIILANVCAIFTYYVVCLVNIINSPIENGIKNKFCKEAKEKIDDSQNLNIIGITGSYGKTSTKYAINTILSQKFNTLMTPESYNTTMGVVRTINEKLSPTHQMFICEMGAKNIGDIKEICDIVKPKYGVLTAIGPQHLDTFGSVDNVRKAKLELLDSLPEDGLAFVNWEDENIRNSKLPQNIVKFGFDSQSDYYAENITVNENGSNFDVVLPNGNRIEIKTKLLGKLNILNIVGAVAVADKFGMNADEIKIGAKYLKPVPHRLQLKKNPNGSIIIDDAYNSNTKGANMALEILKQFDGKQRILITPGIVELGGETEKINKELGRKAVECADYVILVGEKQTEPILKGLRERDYPEQNIYVAKNLEDALAQMNKIVFNNSVVLLENDLPDNYL